MRAKKQNKQYTITAVEVKGYQARGFDIYDDSGALLQVGAGKTVPYAKYQDALNRIAELESALNAKGGKGGKAAGQQ